MYSFFEPNGMRLICDLCILHDNLVKSLDLKLQTRYERLVNPTITTTLDYGFFDNTPFFLDLFFPAHKNLLLYVFRVSFSLQNFYKQSHQKFLQPYFLDTPSLNLTHPIAVKIHQRTESICACALSTCSKNVNIVSLLGS